MAIGERTRAIFLAYFITHIPATMMIDSQVVLPRALVPAFARKALEWHIATNNDVLMANQPSWLRGLVACELLFQLPFFFVAVKALMGRKNWIRGYCIAYGAHTATTLVPILQYIWEDETFKSEKQRVALIGIYAPYLIVPLWLMMSMLANEKPFGDDIGKKKR
jgi:hypothetical protein